MPSPPRRSLLLLLLRVVVAPIAAVHLRPRRLLRSVPASASAALFVPPSVRPSASSLPLPPRPRRRLLLGSPPASAAAMSSSSSSNMDGKAEIPRVDFAQTETVGSTRWLRLETLSYRANGGDASSPTLKWDRCVRTTKASESSIDAVVILAILRNDPSDPSKDEVVLVRQFRPPVDAFTLELPAGLIDKDEDPGTAALREFKEETGYVGSVAEMLPASYLSPGLTNESACLVRLEVDMTNPHNKQIHAGQIQNEGLDGCEKDRGLEKLLLPRQGLLEALNERREKEGVKVFAALYSLALGMSLGEEGASKAGPKRTFPLIDLELDPSDGRPTPAASQSVVSALRESGFLLVRTSLLPPDLQRRALKAASRYLESPSSNVVTHPVDPKRYIMLEGTECLKKVGDENGALDERTKKELREWYEAAREARDALLRCIATGLDMSKDHEVFVRLHDEDRDALRLLRYPPGDSTTGNRCKEHSDYGTLTLLLTDGVGGLEAHVDGAWRPVPYAEGCIVVNVGSILSEWTGGELKATLHRVAGPASKGSTSSVDELQRAVAMPRISVAYFADPNGDVSASLAGNDEKGGDMSVADYIRWRSGGDDSDRSGVAFASNKEASRLLEE
ncbi:hypothetical protein ACHAWF_008615 [Thalassiosira exigua]